MRSSEWKVLDQFFYDSLYVEFKSLKENESGPFLKMSIVVT